MTTILKPSYTSDPMWDFVLRLLAYDPDLEFSGTFANKSGYHNTVNNNLRNWPGEYSTRLALDLQGDRTKSRGVDISSKSAKNGDYRNMAKYGNRLKVAYDRRDPRLRKWREALGQTDTDKAPEGLDFQGWYTRVPDSTHEWHWHLSILTLFVNDPEAYEAMFSILIGESLESYNTRMNPTKGATMGHFLAEGNGGQLYVVDNDGLQSFPLAREELGARWWLAKTGIINYPRSGVGGEANTWKSVRFGPDDAKDVLWIRTGWSPGFGAVPPKNVDISSIVTAVVAAVQSLQIDLDDADVDRLVAAVINRPDNPLTAEDLANVKDAVKGALREGTA